MKTSSPHLASPHLAAQSRDRQSEGGSSDDLALSVLLREGSAVEHREAEGSTFMSELLQGRVNAYGYLTYLTMLREVYRASEQVGRSLAASNEPCALAVVDQDLERLDAIESDVEFWGQLADREAARQVSPATARYVERIHHAESWAGLFAAHHYTRYLGDLSGGQAIGRILTRTFSLPRDQGVAFYRFANIPKPKPYKDAYRQRLDGLRLDLGQKRLVLAETRYVFQLNGALFSELSADLDSYRK